MRDAGDDHVKAILAAAGFRTPIARAAVIGQVRPRYG
jgi:hypothetical protein